MKTVYAIPNCNTVKKALDWLKDKGITSIGRYGKWHFQGMAESIQEGLTVDV